ncbi:hypothetical protein CSE15_16530 [Bacillus altitudinis]|uniref:hypothetical protein n=1 Tax=Bacillus altitudinis TaxID=293387 RepID=UPI000C15C5C3|nr:hypothetical protein [Bacillus altitudinis]ATP95452.1 hypothetical protein CSE15_16530 [Bacillus altitudinis]
MTKTKDEEIAELRQAMAALIAENERLRDALTEIKERKMSTFLSTRHMNEFFIKTAKEALK